MNLRRTLKLQIYIKLATEIFQCNLSECNRYMYDGIWLNISQTIRMLNCLFWYAQHVCNICMMHSHCACALVADFNQRGGRDVSLIDRTIICLYAGSASSYNTDVHAMKAHSRSKSRSFCARLFWRVERALTHTNYVSGTSIFRVPHVPRNHYIHKTSVTYN